MSAAYVFAGPKHSSETQMLFWEFGPDDHCGPFLPWNGFPVQPQTDRIVRFGTDLQDH